MHETYMKRCLQLAANGEGLVEPNPMVGCVIVHMEKIIAEGFHQQYGSNHAEVNAINKLQGFDKFDECSLYVNLEPCSHTGKTPPCADLIIEKKFKQVIIAQQDPNPLVAGKGIEKLKAAGIEITAGVCEKEALELNKRFNCFHQKNRPFVTLKWAQTADDIIAPQIRDPNYQSLRYISNQYSVREVHRYRACHAAILVGSNTAFNDNPTLDVRHWEGKNPVRVVWDPQLKLESNLHIFDGTTPTLILVDQYFQTNKHWEKENVEFIYIDFSIGAAKQTLEVLYSKGIQSLLVEGGRMVLQTFISENIWDETKVFTAPQKTYHTGLKAPFINHEPNYTENISGDILKTYIHG